MLHILKQLKITIFLLKTTIFRGHIILIPNSKTSLGCTFESLEIVVAYQWLLRMGIGFSSYNMVL